MGNSSIKYECAPAAVKRAAGFLFLREDNERNEVIILQKINTKQLKQSTLSGILIGIGVIINLLSENRYIGAMLFSFALLTIIQNALPLYTGKIGFIRELKITDLLQILLFNLIGSAIPVLMVLLCNEEFYGMIKTAAQAKFSHSFLDLFLLGSLCGVLMLIAVYTKKPIITVFCIMIFILSGYEHCIADFPFLILNPGAGNLIRFLCVVLGNSIGAIAAYELISDQTRQKKGGQK